MQTEYYVAASAGSRPLIARSKAPFLVCPAGVFAGIDNDVETYSDFFNVSSRFFVEHLAAEKHIGHFVQRRFNPAAHRRSGRQAAQAGRRFVRGLEPG